MPDYSKSKIYKLICDDPELVYYGSTTQKYLSSRLCEHKKKITTALQKNWLRQVE